MKIDINKIPLEGLTLEEQVNPSVLDLETDIVKFSGPIKIKAEVSKITNAITVSLSLNGLIHLNCSRCLKEFEVGLKKDLRLNYQVNRTEPIIDLDQDIREEIILDYPIKPLCNPDCRGLCPKCGKNLNPERIDPPIPLKEGSNPERIDPPIPLKEGSNEGDCKCVSF